MWTVHLTSCLDDEVLREDPPSPASNLWPMYTMASVLEVPGSPGFCVELQAFLGQTRVLGKGRSQLGSSYFVRQPMLLFLENGCSHVLHQGFCEDS